MFKGCVHVDDVGWMGAHFGVHSGEDVIEKIDRALRVASPRKRNSRLLAAAQVDATLTNLAKVTPWKRIKVSREGAGDEDLAAVGPVGEMVWCGR